MTGPALAILCGALIATGIALVVGGLMRHAPRLTDALSTLDGRPATRSLRERPSADVGWLERLGAAAFRVLKLPLSPAQRHELQLRDRSIGDFYAEKLIWAVVGIATPPILGAALATVTGAPGFVPVIAGLICGVVGFFVPDLLLRRRAKAGHSDAREALFTYFDLVVLERLANRSAPQALAAAADVSDHPVFARIRTTLDTARLEQAAPYSHLRTLAAELDFAELDDIADVMRLDESGAALADVLRARVKELRDAHLAQQRIEAQTISERMTLPMTVPTLIFTLILFVPPLLRLMSS